MVMAAGVNYNGVWAGLSAIGRGRSAKILRNCVASGWKFAENCASRRKMPTISAAFFLTHSRPKSFLQCTMILFCTYMVIFLELSVIFCARSRI
jgi:hypothetical protein